MPLMKVVVFDFCPLVVGYLDCGILCVGISLLWGIEVHFIR